MARKTQPNLSLATPGALLLLAFGSILFIAVFDYLGRGWLIAATLGIFTVTLLGIVAASGLLSIEFKRVLTNAPKPEKPQKISVEVPLPTVTMDPDWKDAPALDAEFTRHVDHQPARPVNFTNYRQKARSVSDG
jgi:uncharacterized protein (DUF58 family)